MTKRARRAVAGGEGYWLRPIGIIRSRLRDRADAPMQGTEGAPDAWLEIHPWAREALRGIRAGDALLVLTWLHQGRRDVLRVHPRSDPRAPLAGVFATRSPDRPNPIGLHPVTVRRRSGGRLRIGPIEAIDGTPVVDVKPVVFAGEGLPRGAVLRSEPPAEPPEAGADRARPTR
jgi:tRNA-Thr(GGU) m(6)t(6)A37 methyltransferase TsaA